jgi:hypothetical protein
MYGFGIIYQLAGLVGNGNASTGTYKININTLITCA